ncbi:zinc finger protein 585A-like [Macrobrachium rosenbergii]|uniref:zinc finger protein 585A-like n=1 Tax=Macrobrachium rosenbergii TaxID=79674 RepID=UPI0034D723A8
MENINKGKSAGEVMSLETLDNPPSEHGITPSSVTMREESIVTSPDGEQNTMILCPISDTANGLQTSHHHISPDATLTYAALDAGGNLVLQPLKPEHQRQVSHSNSVIPEGNSAHEHSGSKGAANSQANSGPQLVVVGEGVGDTKAYIYIQGEEQVEDKHNEIDGENAHTITLNSADGSTLQTLPASYTQHLEHTYGDIVLVNSNNDGANESVGRVNSNISDVPSSDPSHPSDSLLLFSVQPIKLENQNASTTLTLSPSSQPSTQHKDSKSRDSMLLENVMDASRNQQESVCLEERLPEEETPTIEERLATRDSLLPPKRRRRFKSYVCPICQVTFKSNYQFNIHQSTHKGHNMWQCDICKYSCDTATDLKQHKISVHQDARPYKCLHCELRFPKGPMLEDHIRSVHNKERPYSCTFCNKGFYRPHDLKMHLNLHLGIKCNVCYVCGRQFSHPSNLIRHHRLHTGIKPYVCPTCGKRFTQLILLHKHRTTHLPGAGVCPQCPSTFRSAAGLKKHYRFEHKKTMTLHEATVILRGYGSTVGRRYYCQVCGDKFLLKSDLKKHEQKEHSSGAEMHCPSCNKMFTAETVKFHICLSTEEEERMNEFSADDPPVPAASTSAPHCKSQTENQGKNPKDLKVEEEEYLVMYITPEGESVSYVMKKGDEGSLDKVLQINAPVGDPIEDSLQRPALPEETIMINVQDRPILSHQQEEASLITIASQIHEDTSLNPSNTDHQDGVLPNPSQPNTKSVTLQNIKLEPQPSLNDVDISQVTVSDNALLPLLTLNENVPTSKIIRKSGLRSIAMKRSTKDGALKNENAVEVKKEKQEDSVLPLTCKDCGKTFKKRWNYQQHIATHDASLRRYKCDTCDMTFAYRSTYTTHVKRHSGGQQVHVCPYCQKTYRCKMSLKKHHGREHMHLRPYQCELCHKDFYSKGDYKCHMRVHNKEHPYICFACGRDFAHLSHLHRHERIHTKERPHKCPFCPKEFIQRVTLRIHLKKHEKEHEALRESTGPEGNVEVSLTLGHDLPEDASQITNSVPETMADTSGSSLITSHNSGNSIRDNLNDPTSSDVRLAQNLVGSVTTSEGISVEGFPAGTIILAQSENEETGTTYQFTSDPSTVVTGMDGDCIAIFVQENLN